MSRCAKCASCGARLSKTVGTINRAAKIGAKLFCNRTCFGMSRRKGKTTAHMVAEKRLYDMAYREKNRSLLKAKKRAYFTRTYDPVKAARVRKKRMHLHVAYCQQPQYKIYKSRYDEQYRAKKYFGQFWESAVLVSALDKEVVARMSKQDIRVFNGVYNKAQFRRREYESTNQVAVVRN